jgi:predicted ATPase
LEQWIVGDRSRLVSIFGKEGVGKTALTAKVAERIQEHFDYIIWRNLRNAPAISELLNVLIKFFFNQEAICLPESVDEKIYLLLNHLRSSRCLIVLDNAESILQKGEFAEKYRPGYEGYGQLFRCIAQTSHQSCLILTSREKLKWLEAKEGRQSGMRSLSLNCSL